MRRRRFRTWAKWACTLAAVLSLAVAVFIGFYLVRCMWASGDGASTRFFLVHGGLVRVGNLDGLLPEFGLKYDFTFRRFDGWYWGTQKEFSSSGLHAAAGVIWE